MTLQDLGNMGEFVGAIAVIATLIYLTVQIRQNSRSIGTAAHNAVLAQTFDLNLRLAQDSEFSSFLQRGLDGELDAQDFARFSSTMIAVIGIMQRIFILYRQSVVDARDLEPAMVFALGILRRPGAKVWWERADRFGFDPRFIDHMNERLK